MAEQPDYEQMYNALMAQLLQQSGAGNLMGFQQPQRPGPSTQPTMTNAGQAVNSPGVFQNPVGGNLAPSYAPQGVMFGGGSPFPVDPGPARLQNTLVGLRDLLSSPVGQQALAALKKKMGS